MKLCGSVVFDNLALLFAVGIAVGMARSDKGTAGLAAVLCYIVMNKAINASLLLSGTLASDNLAAAGQANVPWDRQPANRRDGRDYERAAGPVGTKTLW